VAEGNFGHHIKTLRQAAGLTKKQAANQSGMSLSEWEAMEQDDVPARLRMIRPIAATLNVLPHEVF